MTAIDTLTNTVAAHVAIGQAPQAVAYVPDAVSSGDGTRGLQSLGSAGANDLLSLVPVGVASGAKAPTSLALFDQGTVQVLQAAVTGLEPSAPYVLGLSHRSDGGGAVETLAAFKTNPAGAAIVDAVGSIRQLVRAADEQQRRYLVITSGTAAQLGQPVQVQAP